MGAWRFDSLYLRDDMVEEFVYEATAPDADAESSELRYSARYIAEAMVRNNPELTEYRHPDAPPL